MEIRNERFKQLIDNRFNGRRKDIAAAIGISNDLVSRYVKGRSAIGEKMKNRIEEALQLPANWLDGNDSLISIDVEDHDLFVMFNHLIHLPKDEIERFKQIYELTLGIEFDKINDLQKKNQELEQEKEDHKPSPKQPDASKKKTIEPPDRKK